MGYFGLSISSTLEEAVKELAIFGYRLKTLKIKMPILGILRLKPIDLKLNFLSSFIAGVTREIYLYFPSV